MESKFKLEDDEVSIPGKVHKKLIFNKNRLSETINFSKYNLDNELIKNFIKFKDGLPTIFLKH